MRESGLVVNVNGSCYTFMEARITSAALMNTVTKYSDMRVS